MSREEDLIQAYLRRGLSRRDALKAMGLAMTAGIIAACSPAALGSPSASSAPSDGPAGGSAAPNPSPLASGSVNGLNLSEFTKANVDWQQFKDVQLAIAMLSSPPATDLWKDAIHAFEILSGAKVSITELPQNELDTKVFADLSSRGGAFDVVNVEYALLPGYAKPGLIEVLDSYIADPKVTDPDWLALSDIYPGVLAAGQSANQQFGLPVTSESTILAYRKDIITKAPDTYDELMTAAIAAKKPDMEGIALRGQRGAGMNVYTWAGFLHGFGGDFVSHYPDDLNPTVNTPAAVQAVQYYADILQKAGPAGAANYTNEETQLDAENGKTAMIIEWSGCPVLIDSPKNSRSAGKWGFAQVPQGPNGRWPAIFSWTFAVNANSKNKAAAWGLIQAMVNPAAAIHNSTGLIVPTRKSVADSEVYKTASRAGIAGFDTWEPVDAEALSTAKPDYVPRIAHWQEFGDRVGIALQSVISGQSDAQAAMDAAQKDITSLLKTAGMI
ncbi:MAG TPA: sugar ABC transporter substrate-binding protein [Patescibacteria group bacterium]|nr:sugar ABC transporter substrate-binding protein [Patescibacteria group bacterium]